MAREAADLAVKNSLIKNGIDVLVAKAKYNVKVIEGESGKAVTQSALAFASKATVFASKLFCANGLRCSATTEQLYAFAADTLKLASQLPSCLDGKGEKCADSIKSTAKLADMVLKYFGRPATPPEIQQWATFSADWLRGGSELTKALQSKDPAAYYTAAGDLLEISIKTYTGAYWRSGQDAPSGLNNLLEIIGNGTATWTTCKSATLTLSTLRPGQISGAAAECVSKLNDYFNTRLAEIMSYSMALFLASTEQYNGNVIDGSRVVMGEVLRTGGWAPTFLNYGVVFNESSLINGSKDLKITETIEKIAAKYGVSNSGLSALHSNWYDGWSGDVLRTINTIYYPQLKSEMDALVQGRRDLKSYLGVKFETSQPSTSVALAAPSTSSWDGAQSYVVTAKSYGQNQGILLQALASDGRTLASTAMAPVMDNKDGSSDWRLDLASTPSWRQLLLGSYRLRAALAGMDGQVVYSPLATLSIQRTVVAPVTPVVRFVSSDVAIRVGGVLSVRVEVSGANRGAPILYIRDALGKSVAAVQFDTKLAVSNGTEQWQYQKPMGALGAGDYVLVAKAVGQGTTVVESPSIRLRIDATAPAVTPPLATPPVLLVPPIAAPSPAPSLVPVVTMLDFMPRELTAGTNVKFVAQTSIRSKSVRLVFDLLQGGASMELANPRGNGIDWVAERPVNGAGLAANAYQRPVWAIATGSDGQISAASDKHLMTVKPAFATPVTQPTPTVPAVLPTPVSTPTPSPAPGLVPVVTMLDFMPRELIAGTSVKFVAQTNIKTKSLRLVFDMLQGGASMELANPSGNGIDWSVERIVTAPGAASNAYQRPVWAIATGPGGQVSAASDKHLIAVKPNLATAVAHPSPSVPLTTAPVTSTSRPVPAPAVVAAPPSVPAPVPVPEILRPTLVKGDNLAAGQIWSARLSTNLPVFSADLVFRTGRRIPFAGGALSWYSDDRNAVFTEAGSFPYELQIRRQANAALETFPGGVLTVLVPVAPAMAPVVTSAPSIEQGKSYNLTVRTASSVDRVSVKWPDSGAEQGLRAMDAQRTLWEFGARLFMKAEQLPYTVSVYKEGIVQPVGQITAALNVTAPAAGIRLLDVSKNIVQGESPLFTVAGSLSVARVTVQLGTDATSALAGTGGSGAEQNFRGQVPARVAGPAIPYVITAFNSQGQVAAQVNGSLSVAAAGDALKAVNPIPSTGISQGDYVNWQFLTNRAPAEMWMEFDAPIGRIALNGSYLTRVFNETPGKYNYRLMRRDALGNVFAIQGANGQLQIKARAAALAISSATLNGVAVTPGATPAIRLSGPLSLQSVAPGAKGVVLRIDVPSLGGAVYFQSTSADGVSWTNRPLPTATLNDYFNRQAVPGIYPARLYLGTGGTNTDVVVGGLVSFTIQIVP